jgi:5-methylcytosine-specific restriction endonuclease McrA
MPRRICPSCGDLTQGRGRCEPCRALHAPAQRTLWGDPRRTNRWRTIRDRLVSDAEYCAICLEPLDHQAPGRSRWAPSVDHVIPLSRGGEPYDESNLRCVHYGCNSSLGAKLARR